MTNYQNSQPVLSFKSRIEGKNADVSVYPDRIEWGKTGLLGGVKKTEMIPLRHASSVSSSKDGLSRSKIEVVSPGGAISFRVPRVEADSIVQTITQLMLGPA